MSRIVRCWDSSVLWCKAASMLWCSGRVLGGSQDGFLEVLMTVEVLMTGSWRFSGRVLGGSQDGFLEVLSTGTCRFARRILEGSQDCFIKASLNYSAIVQMSDKQHQIKLI
ncbi:LOW QUALITY PROTEIN: hypothetical protein PoB_006113300 [Plakobranchus ocellatus]|uniref:Uncharacterized protein n=1 Tax=Plakobranchus ocellatus TaxID=259542 RepID=A0AAV4CRW0_9GAST|nr:LOW QUALITY PROTEIN: hypothetical protein PoB_006113300 [Plakobranchus ocellatus]